jgi:hypothetical protein
MLNKIGFVGFALLAAYKSIYCDNETAFVHLMLWSIACGIAFLIQKETK